MTQEQTDAYAKGFKIGWDKAEERIDKLMNKLIKELRKGCCLSPTGYDIMNKFINKIKEGEKIE